MCVFSLQVSMNKVLLPSEMGGVVSLGAIDPVRRVDGVAPWGSQGVPNTCFARDQGLKRYPVRNTV